MAVQERQEQAPKLEERLQVERTALAEAREKLSSTRAALEHRATLVADLKRRLADADAARSADASAGTALAAAERQIRDLQSALSRKNTLAQEVRYQ